MLTVNGGVVIFEGNSSKDMLNDTRCVISAFIKNCKELGISDELIEKTCIQMVAEGFQMLDKNQRVELRHDKNNKGE